MLKRLLLAHFLLVTFAVPVVVYAEESEPSPENPNVLIVSEGSLCNYSALDIPEDGSDVVLRARWIPKEWHPVPAGQYVSTESGDLETCPKDSYCPGLESYVFDENDSDEERGEFACADGFHTDSTGSVSQDACYKTETVACSVKNPYTTEHILSVTYSQEEISCTQHQGAEAVCASSCEIVGITCEEGYMARNVDGVWTCSGDIVTCEPGKYLSGETKACEVCLENHFCGGGQYSLIESQDQGIESCKDGLKAPEGTVSEKDCGIIFRIGEDALYLHGDRRDTDHPVFVVQDSKGKKWYAPLSPVGENRENARKLNEFGATKELHVMFNGEEYTVHTSLYEGE